MYVYVCNLFIHYKGVLISLVYSIDNICWFENQPSSIVCHCEQMYFNNIFSINTSMSYHFYNHTPFIIANGCFLNFWRHSAHNLLIVYLQSLNDFTQFLHFVFVDHVPAGGNLFQNQNFLKLNLKLSFNFSFSYNKLNKLP